MQRATAVLFLLCLRALPQAPPLAFEVAEVKPNKSGEVRLAVDLQPGGRLVMHNVPMKVMIMFAYHLRPEAVSGPPWLESERFDLVAKAPETASPNDLRRMLQTLLGERFKLAVHTESKLMPAYALVLGKSGPKLQASDSARLREQRCVPGQSQPGQRHVDCKHITLPLLADYLQELAPRDFTVPVVDQTGLIGAFDFKLDWTPSARPSATAAADDAPASAASAESGPSIFDAVEVQLGLRLERKKLPLPVVVVDRVERVPIEN
jgi:uncharacterized protein (TIGR03435 family)